MIASVIHRPDTGTEGAWARFEALYRESRRDLYAYVCSLLGDPSAAEDVTALAYERAYRRRRTFDRRRRVATLAAEPPDEQLTGPEDGAEVALRRTAVRAALAGLTARERELVALKFGAGLSGGEIAKVLGMSETGVSTFLYRTMGKLREACDAER